MSAESAYLLDVLSYVGVLTIAVIIDPDHGLDLGKLIVGLHNESELITHQQTPVAILHGCSLTSV